MAGFTRLDLVSDGRGKIGLETVQPGGNMIAPVGSLKGCGVVRHGKRCPALIDARETACSMCKAELVAELERLAGEVG